MSNLDIETPWAITIVCQSYWGPFKPFVAWATRWHKNRVWQVNAEGDSPQEAIKALKTRLEARHE